jgi:hypothetical protein
MGVEWYLIHLKASRGQMHTIRFYRARENRRYIQDAVCLKRTAKL